MCNSVYVSVCLPCWPWNPLLSPISISSPLPPTLPYISSLLSSCRKHKSGSCRSSNLHGKERFQHWGGLVWETGAGFTLCFGSLRWNKLGNVKTSSNSCRIVGGDVCSDSLRSVFVLGVFCRRWSRKLCLLKLQVCCCLHCNPCDWSQKH